MANAEAEAARRSSPLTGEPETRYDAKCHEWDGFLSLGASPVSAAMSHPGSWQRVYELRPLEVVAYWLGIPFRPLHPVYAIIYDNVNRGYYTGPAWKVVELGHQVRIPAAIPFVRIFDLSEAADRMIRRGADVLTSGLWAITRVLLNASERVDAWFRTRRVV